MTIKSNPEMDYWTECISISAEECGVSLSADQLACIAAGAMDGHECYGMAFYSPPPSDRLNEIEREWETKYKALQKEFDRYRGNAETAVKQALNQHSDAQISIGEYGEVFRHGGRTTQIQ